MKKNFKNIKDENSHKMCNRGHLEVKLLKKGLNQEVNLINAIQCEINFKDGKVILVPCPNCHLDLSKGCLTNYKELPSRVIQQLEGISEFSITMAPATSAVGNQKALSQQKQECQENSKCLKEMLNKPFGRRPSVFSFIVDILFDAFRSSIRPCYFDDDNDNKYYIGRRVRLIKEQSYCNSDEEDETTAVEVIPRTVTIGTNGLISLIFEAYKYWDEAKRAEEAKKSQEPPPPPPPPQPVVVPIPVRIPWEGVAPAPLPCDVPPPQTPCDYIGLPPQILWDGDFPIPKPPTWKCNKKCRKCAQCSCKQCLSWAWPLEAVSALPQRIPVTRPPRATVVPRLSSIIPPPQPRCVTDPPPPQCFPLHGCYKCKKLSKRCRECLNYFYAFDPSYIKPDGYIRCPECPSLSQSSIPSLRDNGSAGATPYPSCTQMAGPSQMVNYEEQIQMPAPRRLQQQQQEPLSPCSKMGFQQGSPLPNHNQYDAYNLERYLLQEEAALGNPYRMDVESSLAFYPPPNPYYPPPPPNPYYMPPPPPCMDPIYGPPPPMAPPPPCGDPYYPQPYPYYPRQPVLDPYAPPNDPFYGSPYWYEDDFTFWERLKEFLGLDPLTAYERRRRRALGRVRNRINRRLKRFNKTKAAERSLCVDKQAWRMDLPSDIQQEKHE